MLQLDINIQIPPIPPQKSALLFGTIPCFETFIFVWKFIKVAFFWISFLDNVQMSWLYSLFMYCMNISFVGHSSVLVLPTAQNWSLGLHLARIYGPHIWYPECGLHLKPKMMHSWPRAEQKKSPEMGRLWQFVGTRCGSVNAHNSFL